ncbi:hypothetical protein NHF46_19960 [Arthrobacter alpinus]|nr:hypothetical protein [Arthrobacter alpinus]
MSGTAVAVAEYLRTHYELDAGRVDSHTPCIRADRAEKIYATAAQRDAAVVEAVKVAHATGQPVLLGTHDVATSERFVQLLEVAGIECQVLNARNDSLEAQVIAQAGRRGASLSLRRWRAVAPTFFGRESCRPCRARRGGRAGRAAGHYCGPLLFAASRCTAAGPGRTAGRSGASIIFSSMEDPAANGQEAHGLELTNTVAQEADGDGLVTRPGVSALLDKAQRLAEAERFTTQQNSWKYNELIAYQRRVVLADRETFLNDRDAALYALAERAYDAGASADSSGDGGGDRLEQLRSALGETELARLCRAVMLFELDAQWSDHLAQLSEQRAAIHLRALGRQNPLDEFRRETIRTFEGFLEDARAHALGTVESLEVIDGHVDLDAAGIRSGSATWTYVVDENPFGNQTDQIVKWLLKKMGK